MSTLIVKLNFSRIWGGVSSQVSRFIFIFGNAFKVQVYFLIRAQIALLNQRHSYVLEGTFNHRQTGYLLSTYCETIEKLPCAQLSQQLSLQHGTDIEQQRVPEGERSRGGIQQNTNHLRNRRLDRPHLRLGSSRLESKDKRMTDLF